MTEDSPARPKPFTKHDLAWLKVREFFDQEMVWTLEDTGFRQVNGQWQRQPYTSETFMELCLRWEVLSMHSDRPNVRISDEVAATLPHLSPAEKIAHATQITWSRLGIMLDRIFSKPTKLRNDLQFKGSWGGVGTSIPQDHYLYILILTHLEDDVRRLATEEHMDPLDWIAKFKIELDRRADQRFPGLWDYTPV